MPTPEPLRFTKHAEDVILERKLKRSWIESAARSPEWSHRDPKRAGVELRFCRIPEFGNRVLRTACVESDEEIRVLTVFFDRNARRPL
ncbi:MAG: DUF4258 domain-containing protein [Pseudorhodoplanes sp.]|nr:DUF4258 domain-containing protein [Pseudorhodoplanes sp.]